MSSAPDLAESLSGPMDSLSGRVDHLSGRVDHLSDRMDHLSDRVDRLKTTLLGGFAAMIAALLATGFLG